MQKIAKKLKKKHDYKKKHKHIQIATFLAGGGGVPLQHRPSPLDTRPRSHVMFNMLMHTRVWYKWRFVSRGGDDIF